jgi:hypothetical protein
MTADLDARVLCLEAELDNHAPAARYLSLD